MKLGCASSQRPVYSLSPHGCLTLVIRPGKVLTDRRAHPSSSYPDAYPSRSGSGSPPLACLVLSDPPTRPAGWHLASHFRPLSICSHLENGAQSGPCLPDSGGGPLVHAPSSGLMFPHSSSPLCLHSTPLSLPLSASLQTPCLCISVAPLASVPPVSLRTAQSLFPRALDLAFPLLWHL